MEGTGRAPQLERLKEVGRARHSSGVGRVREGLGRMRTTSGLEEGRGLLAPPRHLSDRFPTHEVRIFVFTTIHLFTLPYHLPPAPPQGGKAVEQEEGGWSWLVVLASFLCVMVLDGIGYSFGGSSSHIFPCPFSPCP